jgi:uncharacterized protein (DUF952 family)
MLQAPFFYHIATPAQWKQYADSIYYEAESLNTEGFIHASTASQVEATLNRYYKSEPTILLLKIEAAKLNVELKYELAPSVNEYFPHIYGQLNKDAIVNIEELYQTENGVYNWCE